jgi:hypothetical protein
MWAAILVILNSLPIVAKAVSAIISFYEKWQEDRIIKHYENKKRVRDILTARLLKATTDEERLELSKALSLLDSSY